MAECAKLETLAELALELVAKLVAELELGLSAGGEPDVGFNPDAAHTKLTHQSLGYLTRGPDEILVKSNRLRSSK